MSYGIRARERTMLVVWHKEHEAGPHLSYGISTSGARGRSTLVVWHKQWHHRNNLGVGVPLGEHRDEPHALCLHVLITWS